MRYDYNNKRKKKKKKSKILKNRPNTYSKKIYIWRHSLFLNEKEEVHSCSFQFSYHFFFVI